MRSNDLFFQLKKIGPHIHFPQPVAITTNLWVIAGHLQNGVVCAAKVSTSQKYDDIFELISKLIITHF